MTEENKKSIDEYLASRNSQDPRTGVVEPGRSQVLAHSTSVDAAVDIALSGSLKSVFNYITSEASPKVHQMQGGKRRYVAGTTEHLLRNDPKMERFVLERRYDLLKYIDWAEDWLIEQYKENLRDVDNVDDLAKMFQNILKDGTERGKIKWSLLREEIVASGGVSYLYFTNLLPQEIRQVIAESAGAERYVSTTLGHALEKYTPDRKDPSKQAVVVFPTGRFPQNQLYERGGTVDFGPFSKEKWEKSVETVRHNPSNIFTSETSYGGHAEEVNVMDENTQYGTEIDVTNGAVIMLPISKRSEIERAHQNLPSNIYWFDNTKFKSIDEALGWLVNTNEGRNLFREKSNTLLDDDLLKAQIAPGVRNKYIGINFTPSDEVSHEEMESSLEETEEFRGNVRSSFYRWTQKPDKDISPHQMTGIYLFSLGATSSSLNKAISNFSPTPEEEKFLKDTVETVRQLEETDLIRASSLQSAYDFPQLTITEYDNIPPDDSDTVFFSRTDEGLSPIPPSAPSGSADNLTFNRIKGELVGLGRSTIEKASKKTGEKVAEKGFKEVSKKAGEKVVKKSAERAVGAAAGAATGGTATVAIAAAKIAGKAVGKTIAALTGIDEQEVKEKLGRLTKIGIPGLVGGFFLAVGTVIANIATLFVSRIVVPFFSAILIFTLLVVFILIIMNSGAYVTPVGSLPGAVPGPYESAYISVSKMAESSVPQRDRGSFLVFANDDLNQGLTVTYTITITARNDTLSNIQFVYDCRVVRDQNIPPCPQPSIPTPPGTITPSLPFTFEYSVTYSTSFTDSFVTDTLTVYADVPDRSNNIAAASATIRIGNPPNECPAIWPTNQGYITQGAYCLLYSHSSMEAIDIGVNLVPVYAGHSGLATAYHDHYGLGNYVHIDSSCMGRGFHSEYAHLESISVQTGQIVMMGDVIGLSGNTGNWTTGPHLHYRFQYSSGDNPIYPTNPPFMMTPYIPKDIPRGCCRTAECNTNIP